MVRPNVLRATLLVALSACCFGSISPLTVIALRSGAALQGIQAWRYLTTAVLLVLYATFTRAPAHPIAGREWWRPRVLLVAGGGQATVATLALLALRWIPASTEAFLFYTYPAWVTLFTALRGVERLTRTRLLALALALGGIAFMVGAPSAKSLQPIGVACALIAAIVYSAYIPVLDRLQRDREPLDVSRAIAVGGAILFLAWAIATNTLFAHFDVRTIVASVLQGILSAGAFAGFLAGLASLGAVRTAITSTIEPFWTTLLGVLLLAQPAGDGTLIGGAAIMAAVLLLQTRSVSSVVLDSSTAHRVDHPDRPTS